MIKKPASMILAHNKQKSIDRIWPEIMDFVLNNPLATNESLYNLFGPRSGSGELKKFIHRCQLRGLKELRLTAKGKLNEISEIQESIQLTENGIAEFHKQRKSKGIVHLSKMDALIDNAHKVVAKESIQVMDGGEDAPGIGVHLAHMHSLHRIAKDALNIDGEAGSGGVKLNLAIITNFDPAAAYKQAQGPVIDV